MPITKKCWDCSNLAKITLDKEVASNTCYISASFSFSMARSRFLRENRLLSLQSLISLCRAESFTGSSPLLCRIVLLWTENELPSMILEVKFSSKPTKSMKEKIWPLSSEVVSYTLILTIKWLWEKESPFSSTICFLFKKAIFRFFSAEARESIYNQVASFSVVNSSFDSSNKSVKVSKNIYI